MICPMCKNEMTEEDNLRGINCDNCCIHYHKGTDDYFYCETNRFYTVIQLERIAKLKAFL